MCVVAWLCVDVDTCYMGVKKESFINIIIPVLKLCGFCLYEREKPVCSFYFSSIVLCINYILPQR